MRAIGFAAKPFAGATKAADDLIRDEQNIPLFQNALHFGPVALGRHDDAARALNGLGDKRGDFVLTQLVDLCRQLLRCFDTKCVLIHIPTEFKPVGLIDVVNVGEPHGLFVHGRHAAKRSSGNGGPVIGVLTTNYELLVRLAQKIEVAMNEFDLGVVRLRP